MTHLNNISGKNLASCEQTNTYPTVFTNNKSFIYFPKKTTNLQQR